MRLGIVIVAVVATASMASGLPPAYEVTDLGRLEETSGSMSQATSINATGVIVGHNRLPSDGGWTHAVIWDGGPIQELSTLQKSRARAINDSGVVVGEVDGRGVMWSGGAMTYLEDAVTYMKDAQDINSAGVIVGYASASSGAHAAICDHGILTDLGTLGGPTSHANAVNSRAQVVGDAHTGLRGSGNREIIEATLWENGSVTIIPRLSGEKAQAQDINDLGQVVGHGDGGAFIWENGQTTSLGGGAHQAYAINNHSAIVGQQSINGGWEAFVWEAGITHNLSHLMTEQGDWEYLLVAYDINDAGQIVGAGRMNDNSFHGFVANPIPEPATLSLLAIGGMAILRRKRR